jgi:hypothetical protein
MGELATRFSDHYGTTNVVRSVCGKAAVGDSDIRLDSKNSTTTISCKIT